MSIVITDPFDEFRTTADVDTSGIMLANWAGPGRDRPPSIVRQQRKGMAKVREFWIRSMAVMAALLCCLLLIGPLFLVATRDSITPSTYYATLFDSPAVLLGFDSELIQLLFRGSTFLLTVGIILTCGFRDSARF